MRKIAVISDPQLNLQDAKLERNRLALLRYFQNMEVDAVIVCGDITENAREEEWDCFFHAFRQNCKAERLFIVPGNMDDAESESGRHAYEKACLRHFGSVPGPLYVVHESDSCVLFGVAVEHDDDNHPLTDHQLKRLDEILRSAAARGVPAVIFGHYILDGTIDISWKYAELGPQSCTVRDILEKYGGTVVYFSGHTHRGLIKAAGGTLAQVDGVAYISTPSICHPDREHYKADNDDPGTGFVVDLNGSAMRIAGFDFSGGTYIEGFDWTIDYAT